ncbi:MAG TPA: heme lyase CcmF/NrfE family subunit [Steroidobacteraceae bacterium]|nr:heme lyase CcmF/NrfE family subunit [Steroidobacteraceae bacterium]
MIPELGHFALILALVLAGAQAFFGIFGAARGDARWMAVVRPAVAGQFVLVCTAIGALVHAFVTFDFSVLYVASNSNSALPTFYRVAALWGAHEGSLLLWAWILAAWTLAVAIASRNLPASFASRVMGVLGFVSFGFLLFTVATSNPFERLLPAAADGRDLNPVLQDPALAIHPPMLYMGYVGFSVAFAFACAAMLEGKLDQVWARWTRPWTTMAWAFLSVGIALGSWWAYYELGWGGYWFWDPVENASFMPWLVGTALIHSLAATEKRGVFKSWTLLLAILAFSLSLLGTFLVRSGVLTSVHSFAADPTRGLFILAFLIIVVGGALALYAWRAPMLRSPAGFEGTAREAFLLYNNVFLVVAGGMVFVGTLAPLVADALGITPISVGSPYFDSLFPMLMLPLGALVAIGIHSSWKRGQLGNHRGRVLLGLGAAVLVGLVLVYGVYGAGKPLTPIGMVLGIWVILSSLFDPVDRLRRRLTLPRAIVGMTLAHIGLGVGIVAISTVESYSVERDAAIAPGETLAMGRYAYRFDSIKEIEGPNYSGVRAEVTVLRDGVPMAVLQPEQRHYWVQRSTLTEAGIASRWNLDLFVALSNNVGGGRWSVRAQLRPLIDWVWLSAAFMALGGVLAVTDRRYRVRAVASEPAGAPASEPKMAQGSAAEAT